MPFPFTFSLPVSSNPFSNAAEPVHVPPRTSEDPDFSDRRFGNRQGMHKITRRRPSPVLNQTDPPLSRKRGWEPTFAEPSRSTTTLTSTNGYLNTPAKYMQMAGNHQDEYHEARMMDPDAEMPPPAKRRRGLAGTIVSTALSAALIGTAVGLTVYRLWRDRGKEPERITAPPPPYQQEWNPIEPPTPPLQITPSTPRSIRKTRPPIASSSKRSVQRRTRTRAHLQPTPPRTTPPVLFPPSQPEFNFGHEDAEPDVVEDQMDWIGDKLSMLIEEGKKALNREVVVMSDAKEDEFDDGNGAWEEEDPINSRPASISRASSMKRLKRPRSIALFPSYTSHTPSSSPRKPGFEIQSSATLPITPQRSHSRGMSAEAGLILTPANSFREDERAWESPELRESMEKARARLQRNRAT